MMPLESERAHFAYMNSALAAESTLHDTRTLSDIEW